MMDFIEYRRVANEFCERWLEEKGRSFRRRFLSDDAVNYMSTKGKTLVDFTDVEILELLLDGLCIRKTATLDNYLHSYSAFFDFLIERGLATRNPCDSAILDYQSLVNALSKTDAEVYSPKDIDGMMRSLEFNGTLVEVVVRLIYEGFARTINDIALMRQSDWCGGRLAVRDCVPSVRLAAVLDELPRIKYRQGKNGKKYKVSVDGIHLYPNSVRDYSDEEHYVKRVEASIVTLLDIAENELGKVLDPSTIYYSGVVYSMIDKVGVEKFVEEMTSYGNQGIAKALCDCGYDSVRADYFKYRYRFFALKLTNKCLQ